LTSKQDIVSHRNIARIAIVRADPNRGVRDLRLAAVREVDEIVADNNRTGCVVHIDGVRVGAGL